MGGRCGRVALGLLLSHDGAMPVPLDDLPPNVRQAIAERVGAAAPSAAAPTSRCTWRCFRCGQTFTKWAPAERHGNNAGHHRIEVVL